MNLPELRTSHRYDRGNDEILSNSEVKENKFMAVFQVSFGSINELDLLTEHRIQMWKDIHPELTERIEGHRELTRNWIKEKLSSRNMIALIVKSEAGKVAGSGCILIKEDQPRASTTKMFYPYLLSMFTIPEYRHKGVASLIVKEAIRWSLENGYDRISLHASDKGRSVYEKFGFQQTNEMRLKLF
jgi:GNAT superfamily N-acetyltransferase